MRIASTPLLIVLAMVVHLGCGGDTSSDADPDASSTPTADAASDAGMDASAERVCDGPGDCPCFSNHDCPAAHACTSLDDSGENVFCLEGPRGTGVAGEPCVGEGSCTSALCIEDDSGSFCSDLCEDATDCPTELPRCLYIGFGVDVSICAPL